jgi:predicted transposase YdaD
MHEYDIALKGILMRLPGTVIQELTGFAIARWCNAELPEVRNPRVDMLGETADGRLVHIELQSTNDPYMALRMAEYAWAIYRRFSRFPEQIVLYVGRAPMRMSNALEGGSVSVRYRLVDIRECSAEPLLASDRLEDNVIAVLMRAGDERAAVRRVLRRIAESAPARRGTALAELMILAGLRNLADIITQEVQQMPILDDIMDNPLIGPKIRQGIETGWKKGHQEGHEQGREEGREEGERQIVLRQVEKRFGSLPAWAKQKIDAMSSPDLEAAALRLLDAQSLEELLH